MNVQHSDFASRIARIEKGQGNSKSTIFVGSDQTYRAEDIAKAYRKIKPQVASKTVIDAARKGQGKRSYAALALPLAFLIGAFGFLCWRFADFQMNGISGLYGDPVEMLAINVATGMAVAILLCQTLCLTAPQYILSSFLGLVSMGVGFPHVVSAAPDQFRAYFSAAWVGTVLAQEQPLTQLADAT